MNPEYKNKTQSELIDEIKRLNNELEKIKQEKNIDRTILEILPESVVIKTLDGKIIDINKTGTESFYKTREELIGTNIYDLIPENIAEKRKEKIQEAVSTLSQTSIVEERNGKYYESIFFPFITEPDKEVDKVLVFADEITDRINAVKAIRESEERYRILVEQSPYAIFIHLNKKFIYSNKSGLDLLGFQKAEELYGLDIDTIIHPDSKEDIEKRISKIHHGNIVPSIEEKFIKKDGTIIDVESIGMPYNFKGSIAVQVISKDITDRKKTERALKENQRMLSTLMGNLPGLAYRCKNDKNRTMEFMSAGCKVLTGYDNTDFINNEKLSYSDIIYDEDRDYVWNEVQKSLKERRPFELVYRIINPDKKEKWVWEKGEGVYDNENNLIALEGFITDITKMKESEVTVRNLSRAIEQSPVSVVITDLDGNIEYVNPKFTKISGYRSDEVIGKNPRILNSGKNPPELYKSLWDTISSGNEWSGEILNKRKDGSLYWESALISPIKNENGLSAHFLAIKEDITEQKSNDEKLQNSLKEKEVMLREIHHRVKNNLQIISSLLKLQATYITDPTALEFFQISQDRVKSMALIHQQLYRSVDLSSINFGDYLRNLTTHLYQAYGINESNIKLNIDAENISLSIDSAIPCGLLVNELVSNSLKHAFPNHRKGKISIKMNLIDNDKYMLSISDNGVGFPPNIDYRNTKSLGMQLVLTLTEQLDGTLTYNNENGTTFNFIFKSVIYKKRV